MIVLDEKSGVTKEICFHCERLYQMSIHARVVEAFYSKLLHVIFMVVLGKSW